MSRRLVICTIVTFGMAVLPGVHVAHAAGSGSSTGIASGDFDGDGRDDLAVGVPFEDVGPEGDEINDAGAVNVIYGGADGLKPGGNQFWHQEQPGVADQSESGDHFGQALAAGDFDGDGRDDLAIGVPSEGVGIEFGAGAVHILYGSASGLSAAGDVVFNQDSQGIANAPNNSDSFGFSLAAGNLGRSSHDDLVIGVPFEFVTANQAGQVHTLYGSNNGLTSNNAQVWHQDIAGIAGVAAMGENFGFALAIANFGKSGHKDLAVAVPQDTSGVVNDVLDAGAVNVIYGSANGLRAKGDQRWSQDSEGINDAAEGDDGFGWALAAADMGRSGVADLAVGAAFEDVGPEGSEVDNAGGVNVIFGTDTGLKATNDQHWTQEDTSDPPGDFDTFGGTLAAANLGKGSRADLVVGVPFDDVTVSQAGRVQVFYSTDQGPTANGAQTWTQDSQGVSDAAEAHDYFGISLATGDFGKTNVKDLAIGVMNESTVGAVQEIFGGAGGLTPAGEQLWTQDTPQIKDIAEPNDYFGYGVAT